MSDLIDRQQAIEAICMETCGVSLRNERCMVHCTEVQTVEKLPPAQPAIVPCDYAKACNEVSMNRITSAVVYMEILEDFKEYGYVLVDMREVTT